MRGDVPSQDLKGWPSLPDGTLYLVRIRAATREDAAVLAQIVVAGWRWAYRGIISEQELDALDVGSRMRRFRERFDPDILFFVAVNDDDLPIGFAVECRPPQLSKFDSEIGGLYVDPNATRGGVGKALVTAMAHEFRKRGASSMAIHTLRKNRIGRAFYEKLGGVVVVEDVWRGHRAVWYAWWDLSLFT